MIRRIRDFIEDVWDLCEIALFFMRADARREYRLWWDEGEAESRDIEIWSEATWQTESQFS